MMVGSYTLDLYCDNTECPSGRTGPRQFVAELGATCRREARDAGWLIGPDRVLCPSCSGKQRRPRRFSRGSNQLDRKITEGLASGKIKLVTVSELMTKL